MMAKKGGKALKFKKIFKKFYLNYFIYNAKYNHIEMKLIKQQKKLYVQNRNESRAIYNV